MNVFGRRDMPDKKINPDAYLKQILSRCAEFEVIEHMIKKEKMERFGLLPHDIDIYPFSIDTIQKLNRPL